MAKKTERLAWIALIVSLISCVGLAVGVPIGVRSFIHNATRPMLIQLQPWKGTVTLQAPGQDAPVLVTNPTEVLAGSRIGLSTDAEALLLFYLPDQMDAPVMTAQLYGATQLTLRSARMPRFASSPLPHHVEMDIDKGPNIQITVNTDEHPATLHTTTQYGRVELVGGVYVISVTPSFTEIAVRAGLARVFDPTTAELLALTKWQHTALTANGIGEIALGERDILQTRNGDFSTPLDGNGWTVYTDAASAEEDPGSVRQVGTERPRVVFERFGQGHAETGIRQEIAQNIRGATSLQIRAQLRVDLQTLPDCGSLGTECPLMVRINYTDVDGNPHEWLQGFYAQEGDSTNTPFCAICEWKADHIRVPLGVWYNYESPDLLPLLEEQGIEPAVIQEITLYASGHTYSAQVEEISILIGE